MGISTDAYICYGVIPNDDTGFPWMAEDNHYDIDHWWLYEILGFRHSFELYDENFDYIGGVKPPQEKVELYHKEQLDFQKHNPALPVKIVRYGFGWEPLKILAVPSSVRIAYKCHPEMLNPPGLSISEQEKNGLIYFCRKFGIEVDDEPGWWLSVYHS